MQRASVIVPAFNAEAFVGQAIDSVLVQTESRCEVLVIDDCSQDATVDVVTRKVEQDSRVRLLRNRTNCGPAAARNLGIAHATGEWIVLLDADDEFLPHRIGSLLALGEHHGADMVADNLLLCPDNGEEAERPMLSRQELSGVKWLSAAEFVAGNIGSRRTPRINYGFLQPAFRQSFLKNHGLRYDERNRFGEDFLLAFSCLLQGARWLITLEPMYRYRIRSGSLTEVQSAADLARIAAMEEAVLRGNPAVTSDPALARALRRHHRKIKHFHDYRSFVDAVWDRSVERAVYSLFNSPSAFGHVVTESLLQLPRIALKAASGGYHFGSGVTAAHPGAASHSASSPTEQSSTTPGRRN